MGIIQRAYCNNCQRFVHEEEAAHLASFPAHSISNQSIDEDLYNSYGNSTVSGLDLLIPVSGTRTYSLSGYNIIEDAIVYQTFIDTTLSGLIGQNIIDITNVSGTVVNNYGDLLSISGVVENNYLELQNTQTVISGLATQNETNLETVSGYIEQNTIDISTLSGLIVQNTDDISTVSGLISSLSGVSIEYVDSQDAILSGLITQNSSDLSTISGLTYNNYLDIITISGLIDNNSSDISSLSGELGNYLPLSGGTMSGFITLHADPVDNYHASTKQYVDSSISGSAISGAVADAISSLIQVDLTLGTNLLVTNSGLALDEVTAVINGGDFILGSGNITMKDPGLYQISWNVVSFQGGTTAIRRRNLVCDLNINDGQYFPVGSLGGTYSRSSDTSPYMNVGGDYIITTSGDNETVSIRTRDLSTESTQGVIYETAGGYLRIRLVRKS